MFLGILFLMPFVQAAAPEGQIAFISGTEQEDQCVCLLDVPSGVVTRLGPGKRDGAPVWSPDGAWLAFETQHPDGLGIGVMRADGSEFRVLNHANDWNSQPRWSPDGTRLAYSVGGGPDGRLAVYDLQTNEETVWGGGRVGLMRPVWVTMDDFRRLAQALMQTDTEAGATKPDFAASLSEPGIVAIGLTDEGRSTDIFVVTRDAAFPLPPKALPSEEGKYVEWAAEPNPLGGAPAPELKYAGDLAFESNDGGDREIFVASLLRAAFNLSNHRAADWNPVWSPDGKWIAFESFRSGRRGVYRGFPATVRVFEVAAAADSDNWSPSWSPDGHWLAYVSNRTGDPEIYASDVEGKAVQQLTHHPGIDYAPAWRPKALVP